MKLKLNYGHLANEAFLSGFGLITNIPFSPDEVTWLSRSLDKLQDEVKHYQKARLAVFKMHGSETKPDEWRIDTANPETVKRVNEAFEKLHKTAVEIILVRRIKLPAKMEITAAQYKALLDAGVIEAFTAPEPPEETPTPGTAPTPAAHEPAPAPARNGEVKATRHAARATH